MTGEQLRHFNEMCREDFGLASGQIRILLALYALQVAHGPVFARSRAICDICVAVDGSSPNTGSDGLTGLTRLGLIECDTSQGKPWAYRITLRGVQRLIDGGVSRRESLEPEARAS